MSFREMQMRLLNFKVLKEECKKRGSFEERKFTRDGEGGVYIILLAIIPTYLRTCGRIKMVLK
jgi:hypothetical protein